MNQQAFAKFVGEKVDQKVWNVVERVFKKNTRCDFLKKYRERSKLSIVNLIRLLPERKWEHVKTTWAGYQSCNFVELAKKFEWDYVGLPGYAPQIDYVRQVTSDIH